MKATSASSWQANTPAPLPAGLDVNELFAGIYWHQKWELFKGVFTPGNNPAKEMCDFAGVPQDLRGLRVLDVGAWHGCCSFECERRGAAEVVALSLEGPEAVGFTRLRDVLGSKVNYVQESAYNLDPGKLGKFDVVLFFGVLYHLRYPLLAIDKLRSVCRGQVFVETHVIDDYFLTRGWLGNSFRPLKQVGRDLPQVPLWRFYKGAELNKDASNWFGPNVQAVIEAFESAGFLIELKKQWTDRAAFAGHVTGDLKAALDKSYEGEFEDNKRFIGI